MTLVEIYYVSQFISSVAVVGSLIYLGLQMRHAERSQRGIMQQGRAERTSHASLTFAHPDFARIWCKGGAGDPDLTCEEFTQWMFMCRAMFLSGEDSLMQHKAGLLAASAYESYVSGVRHYMAFPGIRAAWKLSNGQFGQEFRNFVDSILERVPAAGNADAYSEWRALVQSAKIASVPIL